MPKESQEGRLKFFNDAIKPKKRALAMPPGYLEYRGQMRDKPMSISVVNYDTDSIEHHEGLELERSLELINRGNLTWVRVVGLHEVDKLSALLNAHQVHALLQEDIIQVKHRPKVEVGDDYVLVIVKVIVPPRKDDPKAQFRIEHASFLLMDGVLISFQESEHSVFNPVVRRLNSGNGKIRKLGCDYLLWALLDAVVDHYFLMLDALERDLETMDEQSIRDVSEIQPLTLYRMRNELAHVGRMFLPVREVVSRLERGGSSLINDEIQPFLRDLADHAEHVVETVELMKDQASSLREFTLSEASNKMNEVMKVLTIFSSIFLPLTFLAGIYGMNFEWIPELQWQYGYPVLWGVFILLAGIMFIIFRKLKWI